MNSDKHGRIVSLIWAIADDVLRDLYVRGKYRDVIPPMTVPPARRSARTDELTRSFEGR